MVRERHSEVGVDLGESKDGWGNRDEEDGISKMLLVAKREGNFADGDLRETFGDVASHNNESVVLLG